MTIVRPTFFGCRLLFATRNFVFGMNNVVTEYQISSISRMPCFVNENWSLFRPMKLVFISTNEIHPRIKHLPINKLRGT